MAFSEYINRGDTVEGWAAGTSRFHDYNESITCDEESAAFLSGLTIQQQIAATRSSADIPAGYKKVSRECQSSGNTETYAYATNADFTPDESTESTTPNQSTGGSTSTPPVQTIAPGDESRYVLVGTFNSSAQ